MAFKCHLNSYETPEANSGVKSLKKLIMCFLYVDDVKVFTIIYNEKVFTMIMNARPWEKKNNLEQTYR